MVEFRHWDPQITESCSALKLQAGCTGPHSAMPYQCPLWVDELENGTPWSGCSSTGTQFGWTWGERRLDISPIYFQVLLHSAQRAQPYKAALRTPTHGKGHDCAHTSLPSSRLNSISPMR